MKVIVKLLVLVNVSGVLATGCDEFKSQEDFLEVKVKPEQTREVKTLKLEERKSLMRW